MFIGRTDVEAETLALWPPDAKSWLIWKDPDIGKDWGQEEKGTTEDEIVGWHHWLDGHGFGWTPGVGDGQGGLACCGSWGCRVGHDWVTELNWTEWLLDNAYVGLFKLGEQICRVKYLENKWSFISFLPPIFLLSLSLSINKMRKCMYMKFRDSKISIVKHLVKQPSVMEKSEKENFRALGSNSGSH